MRPTWDPTAAAVDLCISTAHPYVDVELAQLSDHASRFCSGRVCEEEDGRKLAVNTDVHRGLTMHLVLS